MIDSKEEANSPVSCTTCQGWGVVRDQTGTTTATCPQCRGHGSVLQLQNYSLVAHLPTHIGYGETSRSLIWLNIRPWLFGLALIFTFVFGFMITIGLNAAPSSAPATRSLLSNTSLLSLSGQPQSSFNLVERLTVQTSWAHLLFWSLLLFDLYALFIHQHDQEPPHQITDLRQTDERKRRHFHQEPDGSIDIIPFFTQNARLALDEAIILTERKRATVLTPDILLTSLLCSSKTSLIMASLEKDSLAVCKAAIAQLKPDRSPRGSTITIAPETRAIILQAFAEAFEHGFNAVDVEDYLLVMSRQAGPLQAQLEQLDLTYEQIRSVAGFLNEELETIHQWQFWQERGRLRPKGYMNHAWTARPTPFLDQYSRDFTQLAALGNLPIVKVRDREIEQIMNILASGEKNNALLVGEPGVGKTSIIGAVAARMVAEQVPEPLKDKRLIELDLAALVSGGRSEKTNIDRVLQEVKSAGNVILFIGHIETLVNKQGGLTAAALLEAASRSAQLQIIGTATYGDYHRYIESSASFANSFQKVEIAEVNNANAIIILEEEAPAIQSRYKVLITYPAIKTAVELSRKLIPDQVLPEKGVEVLRAAAQRAGNKSSQKSDGGRIVTKELVQAVIAERTNVPVQELTTSERNKLMNLATIMKQRVIGQDKAVEKIAEALRRARAGLKDEQRPIGSFLFVGPTGVGKTETARTLAGSYFGSRQAMVRIDLSEYQDAKAIYRLIGAPASSAAEYTEGGALTQPVRERPYSIILLDEIEKAHPDVLNLFLQLLDDGRLTENTGRTVSFANTIVIATSNAGAPEIAQTINQSISVSETAATDINNILETVVQQALAKQFKPEFLNRFDAIVTFRPLTPEHVQTIATIMLSEVATKLKEQQVEAVFANDVIAYVSRVGFDPKFGARPLRRAIQDNIETKLADLILSQKVNKRQKLVVTCDLLGL